jgi:hypothetical protein
MSMRFIRNNKFIFFNLIALLFVKAVFSYSGTQFASLLDGIPLFAKGEIVSQTNALRSSLGLNQLKENPTLDSAAAQKLQDMINNQYFAHTSPAGVTPWHWIDINNYNYTYAGENLAIGFSTAKDTLNAWENSPTHRENLLNSKYKEIGVAVAPANIQGNSGFLVVQVFGTPSPVKTALRPTKPAATPLVTPANVAAATPRLQPAQTQQQSVPAVQSAEKTAQIEKPIAVNLAAPQPKLDKVSKVLDVSFIIYALAAFLVSLLLIMLYGLKKNLVIRTAVSFAVIVLALVVPVLHLSHVALII